MLEQQPDEESIFRIAKELAGEHRIAYLDQVCAGDQVLRERVESLLDAHEKQESFLKSKLDDRVKSLLDAHHDLDRGKESDRSDLSTANYPPVAENPGESIGRYKLMEQIGEGGMGTVFVAQQEKPIRRKVALKVIKPGMDSKAVIARFEAERQALAMMDHPNIAKVLDAGTTESGHPYFVMDLVSGIEITDYCDQRKMSIRQRLELFTQVCQAIQHAHQKGIIHRDIKPGNVLVTEQDGNAVPKVIDFGVAKAIGQSLTDRTIYTSFQSVIGTPLYMSPEQAALSNVDVDTRSDVYSLGVLLYELLTGATPFDKETFKNAAQDEVLRMIREQDPPKPSTRISTLGDRASQISEGRDTDFAGLGKSVRGDLDWIVMKALEKDRNRRFDSPNEFSQDVARYLDNEPVQSRPPTIRYRAAKYLQRNRVALTMTSLVFLLLLAGFASTIYQWDKTQLALDRLRVHLIERGINDALIGNKDRVEKTIQVGGSDIGESWEWALRGALELHRGNNSKAQTHLQKSIEIDGNNVAAKSMLSIAYYHNGQRQEWAKLMKDFERWQSRSEYEELDRLFLAYAQVYVEYGAAAVKLEKILTEHPDWIIAHVLLAIAWAEQAQFEGDKNLAKSAIQEIEIPLNLCGDNPFVLTAAQFVHEVAIRLQVEPSAPIRKRSAELIAQIEPFKDYNLATLMVADYYDIIGPRAKALKQWEVLFNGSRSFFRSRAIAEYYREGRVKEVSKLIPDDPESKIARAFVFALSDEADQREEANGLLDDFLGKADKSDTWFVRANLLQLMLLLKKPDLAKQKCTEWASRTPSTGSEQDDPVHQKLFLDVTNWNPQSVPPGFRFDSDHHIHKHFIANYYKALMYFSQNKFEEAHRHLSICNESPGQSTEHHWARAFAAQWPKSQ